MKLYTQSFLAFTMIVSFPCVFLFAEMGSRGDWPFALTIAVFCVSCWILYYFLDNARRGAFAVSFILVSAVWCSLLVELIRSVHYANRNGGVLGPNEELSPLEFLLGLTFDNIPFVLVSIPIVLGIVAYIRTKQTWPESDE